MSWLRFEGMESGKSLQATRKALVRSANIYKSPVSNSNNLAQLSAEHVFGQMEPLTRAAMAVQSSAPNLPPFLRRAHIRKAMSTGQMTTKTAAGMYIRYALLSLGSSAGAVALSGMPGGQKP